MAEEKLIAVESMPEGIAITPAARAAEHRAALQRGETPKVNASEETKSRADAAWKFLFGEHDRTIRA